jgi:hypothetical protein
MALVRATATVRGRRGGKLSAIVLSSDLAHGAGAVAASYLYER